MRTLSDKRATWAPRTHHRHGCTRDATARSAMDWDRVTCLACLRKRLHQRTDYARRVCAWRLAWLEGAVLTGPAASVPAKRVGDWLAWQVGLAIERVAQAEREIEQVRAWRAA